MEAHLTPELAELLKLAQSATPGPWDAGRPKYPELVFGALPNKMGVIVAEAEADGDLPALQNLHNAAYIAAANPATVTALIERLIEAEDRVAELAKAYDGLRAVHSLSMDLNIHERARLRRSHLDKT